MNELHFPYTRSKDRITLRPFSNKVYSTISICIHIPSRFHMNYHVFLYIFLRMSFSNIHQIHDLYLSDKEKHGDAREIP